MQKKAITSHSYDTLDEQSQAIQDYVVSHVSQSSSSAASSSSSSSNTNAETLIVAPVIDTASFQHQFGDYFGSALQQTALSSTATPSAATSDTASPSTSSSTSSSSVEQQAIVRLQSALNLAKKSGMHVGTPIFHTRGFHTGSICSYVIGETDGSSAGKATC
jgi:hypothetical protein